MSVSFEIEVVPNGSVGAELRGVEVAAASAAQIDAIRKALGDLVLWDNRTTMHRRDAFDPKSRRVMHRTQIKGSGAHDARPALASGIRVTPA